MNDKKTIYSMVRKMIGEIEPVGDAMEDDKRWIVNMSEYNEVVYNMVDYLCYISTHYTGKEEYGASRIGREAVSSLIELKWMIDETLSFLEESGDE